MVDTLPNHGSATAGAAGLVPVTSLALLRGTLPKENLFKMTFVS